MAQLSPRKASDVLPQGARSLVALSRAEAADHGEEAEDLARLFGAGVVVADALILPLSSGDPRSRLLNLAQHLLERAPSVRLRPLFPSRALASRFERLAHMSVTLSQHDDAARAVDSLLSAVSAPEVTAALGGGLSRLSILGVAGDADAAGRAASANPLKGDPDEILVWESAASPWLVDRRTTRVTESGEGHLDAQHISRVADLADRAQLALGHPVEIEWMLAGGRPVVIGSRGLVLRPSFTQAPFRLVSLVAADEGVVAPLAVDALDKALRSDDPPSDEACVRRIYARPYRRMDERAVPRGSSNPVSIARAYARAGRAAMDVAAKVAASRRFEQSLSSRMAAVDAVDLSALDDEALLDALRDRQRLVIEALRLLNRGRVATIATLAALEATVGALPRECYPALAHLRPTRARRRVHDKLARLARRIEQERGMLVGPSELPPPLRRKWSELAASLEGVRPLGIDVSPLPWGANDALVLAAMRTALVDVDDARERARRNAMRRLLATARGKSFGRSRETVARSLGMLLSRVASAKGRVAEGLAAAHLRLRAAAIEAGRRLAGEGLVESPEDALYLYLAEIGQGLAGEPGAYAARVRLRREDDERWARYEPPR